MKTREYLGTTGDSKPDLRLDELLVQVGLAVLMGGITGGVLTSVIGFAYRAFSLELGALHNLWLTLGQNGIIIFALGFGIGGGSAVMLEFDLFQKIAAWRRSKNTH